MYSELNRLWLASTGKTTITERFNMKVFAKMINSVGPSFLIAVDKFYSHLIVTDLQDFISIFEKNVLIDKILMEVLSALQDTATLHSSNIPAGGHQFYLRNINKFTKKILSKYLFWIMEIGRIQILRKEIAFEVNKTAQFYSKHLESSLKTMNE